MQSSFVQPRRFPIFAGSRQHPAFHIYNDNAGVEAETATFQSSIGHVREFPPLRASTVLNDIIYADEEEENDDDFVLPANITIRNKRNEPKLPKQLDTNITVRVPRVANTLDPNVSVRKPKPEVSPIGKMIIRILGEKDVAKLYSYIHSTRLFEDCRNNVKLMSSLKDQYYHIPIDIWFPLTGISVQMWRELTQDIKNTNVLGGEMNPCIYILKPDTQIRTELRKCPLF